MTRLTFRILFFTLYAGAMAVLTTLADIVPLLADWLRIAIIGTAVYVYLSIGFGVSDALYDSFFTKSPNTTYDRT